MPVKAHSIRTWPKPGEVFYPESDGKPMADNTEQFNWIVLLVENLKIYDPDKHEFRAWLRQRDKLEPVENLECFQSPRLRIRFWPTSEDLKVETPDGRVFETHTEVLRRAMEERRRAETERQRAESERQRAETERQRAEAERQRAEMERQRADEERRRADRLAEKLRSLGMDPEC